jgi:hypothetical protein
VGQQEEAQDPVLEALWKRVLEDWDDDKTHAALLQHAVRAGALPEIAGRYRAIAGDPTKAEVAQKRIEGIMAAATEMLMSMKTPRPGKVPLPITLSAVAICLTMLGWLAMVLWSRR